MASFNLAELFEQVVATVPDREALVTTERRLTYRELDDRASRLASHLASLGVGRGDHVGLHLLNGSEYLEGMLAAFKLSAVPVNVNYRYVARELAYVYDNADLTGLVLHRRFGPAVLEALPAVPSLAHFVIVDDGSGADAPPGDDYEAALAAADPEPPPPGRSSDDHYIAYTGGTTGLPKGVVWRHEDIFFAALGGGDPLRSEGPIDRPDELAGRVPEMAMTNLTTPPLMHVSAHWGAFQVFYSGGRLVLPNPGSFDAEHVVGLVESEQVSIVTLVGDAMMRPFLAEIETGRHDVSTLFVLASGGAPLSDSAKRLARQLLPNVIIMDGYGSTELGVTSTAARMPGAADEPLRFELDDHTAVLDESLEPVTPGSGMIGHLARSGRLPIGYYGDEEKTAATFVQAGGRRWALSGDYASVDADGRIELRGRGSVSINSGGEKVFPEEVEKVLVGHAAVTDAVVVGVPDERWGSRVVAVVSLAPGQQLALDDVQAHCRQELAGFKVPRDLVEVPVVERNPNGKADYRWALETASAAADDRGVGEASSAS